MSAQVWSIVILFVVFLIGTVRPVNLGALALVATFGVGALVAGEDVDTIVSGFPADIFILLFGVTYLFAIASLNGTIEWLVNSVAKLVRGHAALIPWAIFFVAAIPTTAGALGPAGVALLAPISLRLAKRYDINPRLAGLMVVHGSAAGNFSPLNVLGVIVNGTVERSGLPTNPIALFAANFAYNVVLGAVIYLVFGGMRHVREMRARKLSVSVAGGPGAATAAGGSAATGETVPNEPDDEPPPRLTMVSSVTLLGIVAVACGALVFDLDIGMLAVAVAVLLNAVFPATSKGAVGKVAWPTILLICGIITYVALLQRMGTVKMIGDSVASVSSPLLAAFLMCVIAAVVSAFASSTGILGALIPLAIPFLSSGDIGVIGVVIAVAISATVVDATPFSTVGALAVANCPENERDRLYRGMLAWGFAMVVTAPIATMLFFILPASA